jgi:hypothetical protein
MGGVGTTLRVIGFDNYLVRMGRDGALSVPHKICWNEALGYPCYKKKIMNYTELVSIV